MTPSKKLAEDLKENKKHYSALIRKFQNNFKRSSNTKIVELLLKELSKKKNCELCGVYATLTVLTQHLHKDSEEQTKIVCESCADSFKKDLKIAYKFQDFI